MGSEKKILTLRMVTPRGCGEELRCDSIHLQIPDGKDGNGGGSVGIRPGHMPALISLAGGQVRASLAGKTVYEETVSSGFATIRDNVVTILTDPAEEDPEV